MAMALLWLVPAFPLAGFILLVLPLRLSPKVAAAIGVGSVGLSLASAIPPAASFIVSPPPGYFYSLPLWSWLGSSAGVKAGLYLDALALVMVLVVTVVGFLIHLYSARFMAGDEGYGRFFAYLNLFLASMLILVLADNLLLLFLGWEGVGLCSYLLIGFWYREPANGRAAVKAFLVTRVGDTALLIGLILLATQLGTLDIQELARRAAAQWVVGSGLAVTAAALLLGGAVGKSAQLPLQTWLPDAMAGPTPVSALIHAATMVTAGVYLIARTQAIFSLAPAVQFATALIGAATLLIAGSSAIVQNDLKRCLAYSTISQVGYMFLALGVGAWQPAVYHLATHAVFKSLLFLGAGAVMIGLGDEHDMTRMGGLSRKLPVVFWTFVVGCLSMAAIPPLSAGFYSKDWILFAVRASAPAGRLLWWAAMVGVVLTSIYSFRMLFLVFLSPAKQELKARPGALIQIPLLVLAVPAALLGFLETPRTLGDVRLFMRFLSTALPATIPESGSAASELMLIIPSTVASLFGVGLAYVAYLRSRKTDGRALALAARPLRRFLFAGWGFDAAYDLLLVKPWVWLARISRNDVVDYLFRWIAALTRLLHRLLSRTQGGLLRRYLLALALGAAAVLALVVLL
jgi:NADH-quinone oxidoreductase subunit L